MTIPLSKHMAATSAPPVMEARRWIEGIEFSEDKPLINVSQAAPVAPPPEALRKEIARLALEDEGAHLYGPVMGLPELRAKIASKWSDDYHGTVSPENVAITAGCNMAFAAAMATICEPGDEIILPCPWYFNHKMWADMNGVHAVPLATDDNLLPDLEQAARLIGPRTRAIVLVTPNNPGGVEYPSELLTKFYALARQHQIALVLDETYRDFDSRDALPHVLFRQPDWQDTLVHLYSFSKAYRLTGHRVGAIVAAPSLLAQVEKYLDTVVICPSQIGQKAALWGMENLTDWVAEERAEILARRKAVIDGFQVLEDKGWKLMGCGAFFAYFEHPFDMPSSELAPWLVNEAAVLALPGTMFMPKGNKRAERQLRIAFANVDTDTIAVLLNRLASINP